MSSRTLRTALNLTTLMALVAAPLAVGFTAPASAAEANHLVISEAYGGGGNGGAPYRADFVEIFNPTDNPITMTNWSIQYRSSGSTSAPAASGITTLNGTVPAKGYFLVREATGAGTTLPDLPTADVTGTIAMSGTAFQVWLANTTTAQNPPAGNVLATPNAAIVDFLGVAAGSYETATASGTANATSASRTPTPGTESDNNGADFVIGAPTPKNTTNRYPEVLPVAATNPGNKTAYQGRAMTPFTLAATDGTTPYSWSATGLPDGVNVSSAGVVSGTPTTVGSSTVTATVTDSSSPTPGTASTQFTITVAEFPVKELKTIPEIQGTGDASPLVNQDVQVKGVVTARFPDGGLNGFVIQTPGYDPATDTTPDASDGLFVYQGATPTYAPPAIGDHVTIYNGRVTEFSGLTELTVTSGDLIDTRAATAEEAVTPGTVVPGTDCTLSEDSTDCLTGAALADVREQHESELFLPTADYTVTDGYDGSPWGPPFVASSSSSNFGEIGLAANDDEPLYIPVDKANPTSDPAKWAAIDTYNNAKRISLDDGATLSISGSSNTGIAYPWLQKDYTVRVGAAVTFPKPVIFEYRNSVWKLYPQTRVQPGTTGADRVAIEQDRAQFATPDPVGGNVKIATFNMLNYFVHPVDEWVANGGDAVPGTNRTCTTYKDRNGVALTANTCSWRDPRTDPPSATGDLGPRGAATAVSLSRQEGKEVASINTMAADVMSLEEVENPVKLGYSDRDAALKRLVAALNADWATRTGEDTVANPRWAYVASPRPEAQPTILEQDAIRSAFIFNPRVISPVGRSQILTNSPSFRNAREPLAQAFRHVDGTRDDGFIVIVNHLKSKSSPDDVSTVAGTDNADAGKGAGFYNGDRVRQARALNEFAHSVAEDKGIPAVFMTGDYNAYGAEDPVRTLEAAGFTALEPENNQASYSFGGLAGSLDHVFANEAALEMVTGQTIWPINANEPVYYEYSRYNYNVADLFDGTTPFRSSDHNPEIIGIDAPTSTAPQDVDTVQVLASNDFHGRLLDDPASASAGAAAMAGAVNGLRDANPDTVFAMAGDIVGASTFESFIQNDKPTLDAMNEAGLEVSAAGNHEFDQGYEDLMGRIMAEYDATSNPEGGANWPYLAANVRLGDANGAYALDNDRTDHGYDKSNGATWWKTFPGLNDGDGIRVGFVGAVTEDLDSLVAPSAIDGLAITSVVAEVNAAADQLKASGCGGEPCDLVIELVHEGAPSPSCATIKTDVDSPFGKIVHGASAKVDAIISGHTHLKYNCKVPVAGKTIDRPVVSAGQYGSYLNQLEFDFAPDTNNLVGIRQHVLAMKDYDEDPATKTVVDAAVQVANQRGAEVLGQVAGPFKRARRVDPTSGVVENRGGESTLGNQVAEIQRWKTGADIGVMNPGGLRDDLIGTDDGPGPVTYREAANVQPFANTLVTVDLTGAQLKTLLEQQWQRDPDGNIPSRPFLRLGTSKGFTWTEDSSKAEGNRITGMWLDGVAIDPAGTYTVSANSFLAVGGDNFRALTLGTNKQDTGFTDLQATVEYLGEFANTAEGDAPLAVDYRQHGVGARVQGGPFSAGDTVTIPVDSLSMTGGGTSNVITDTVDSTVAVTLGAQDLGTFPVTSALPTTPYDIPGAATVTFPLPSGLTGGTKWFTLTGAATGTTAKIPVEVVDNRADSTVSGTAADITWGQAGSVSVTVTPGSATGTVELYDGTTKIGEGTLTGDATTIAIPAESLSVGAHTLTLKYLGDVATKPAEGSVSVTVVKASSTVSGTAADVTWGQAGSVSV
ncbi:5'-nucleotidase, partial [Nocardioides sp. BE266]|uniref:ExeM/NucH family extracellular endonuclease n=1 Tax=Nocardioides sp. BE266 TaxID=2817725 RepID=UPI00285931E8